MQDYKKVMLAKPCAALAVLSLALGAFAADVPWTFEGDDTRSCAAASASGNAVEGFTSWTVLPSVAVSPGRPFNSNPLKLVIVVR